MKATVENTKGASRIIKIEVSGEEVSGILDAVYADIGKSARVPGFRPGKVPRDLLETHYAKSAREETLKRAIPEYYLKALKEHGLSPVAAPEIDNVEFNNHSLRFRAKVDVRPQVHLRAYKNLKVIKKKIKVEPAECERALERLRQSKAKQGKDDQEPKQLPELNDEFAKGFGFSTLEELKGAIDKDLNTNARMQVNMDMEKQLVDALLEKNPLEVPESLVENEARELASRLKVDCILRGEKEDQIKAKENQLQDQARKEAALRVKLSFLLDEIGQQEDIPVSEQDLAARITEISQRSGRAEDEVRQYLDREHLTGSVKQELRNKKALQFVLSQAQIQEGP